MVNVLDILVHLYRHLNSKVSYFIDNGCWNILYYSLQVFQGLLDELQHVHVPPTLSTNYRVWIHSKFGELSFNVMILSLKSFFDLNILLISFKLMIFCGVVGVIFLPCAICIWLRLKLVVDR